MGNMITDNACWWVSLPEKASSVFTDLGPKATGVTFTITKVPLPAIFMPSHLRATCRKTSAAN
jgi:hypothetical protein